MDRWTVCGKRFDQDRGIFLRKQGDSVSDSRPIVNSKAWESTPWVHAMSTGSDSVSAIANRPLQVETSNCSGLSLSWARGKPGSYMRLVPACPGYQEDIYPQLLTLPPSSRQWISGALVERSKDSSRTP